MATRVSGAACGAACSLMVPPLAAGHRRAPSPLIGRRARAARRARGTAPPARPSRARPPASPSLRAGSRARPGCRRAAAGPRRGPGRRPDGTGRPCPARSSARRSAGADATTGLPIAAYSKSLVERLTSVISLRRVGASPMSAAAIAAGTASRGIRPGRSIRVGDPEARRLGTQPRLRIAATVDRSVDRQPGPVSGHRGDRVEHEVELVCRRQGARVDQPQRPVGHERAGREPGRVEPPEIGCVEDDEHLLARHAERDQAVEQRVVDGQDGRGGADGPALLGTQRPVRERRRTGPGSAPGRSPAWLRGGRARAARPRPAGAAARRRQGSRAAYAPAGWRSVGARGRASRPPSHARRSRGTRPGRCRSRHPGGAAPAGGEGARRRARPRPPGPGRRRPKTSTSRPPADQRLRFAPDARVFLVVRMGEHADRARSADSIRGHGGNRQRRARSGHRRRGPPSRASRAPPGASVTRRWTAAC